MLLKLCSIYLTTDKNILLSADPVNAHDTEPSLPSGDLDCAQIIFENTSRVS